VENILTPSVIRAQPALAYSGASCIWVVRVPDIRILIEKFYSNFLGFKWYLVMKCVTETDQNFCQGLQ
jgi:hypothetical protein